MKTKVVNLIGYIIEGEATLNLWGGGSGTIEMSPVFLPVEKFNKTNVLRCVNDAGFGCERITNATIAIIEKYSNNGYGECKVVEATHPLHTQHFLGWKELKEQGINY